VLVEVAVDAPAPARLHAAPRLSRFAPSSSSSRCVCSLLTNVALKAGSGRDIYVDRKNIERPRTCVTIKSKNVPRKFCKRQTSEISHDF
jgi:hypothetical protein